MRCGRAQGLLTAAVDGELAPRRQRALDRHLAACESCRRELAGTERMLRALEALPMEAMVPDGVEQATLRRVRQLAGEDAERLAARGWRGWLSVPAFALASVAVAVLAVGIMRGGNETSGPVAPARPQGGEQVARAPKPATQPAERVEPGPVAEPPSEPPPALAAAPDLFVDLPILRNMEKLSHFDAIRTTTLDDETPSGEEAPSNG